MHDAMSATCPECGMPWHQPEQCPGPVKEPDRPSGTDTSLGSLTSQPPTIPRPRREAFYGFAGRVVETLRKHTESDEAALLVTLLTLYGNVLGPSTYVVLDGAQHGARLFTALVGKTGSGRKGTAMRNIVPIFDSCDPEWVHTRILKGIQSGEALAAAVAPNREGERTDERALIYEAELSRFLRVAARDGSVLSQYVRDAFDGDALEVRTKHKTMRAELHHLSMLAHITPKELVTLLDSVEIANGFANRFLLFVVERQRLLPFGASDDGVLDLVNKEIVDRVKDGRHKGRLDLASDARPLWAQRYQEWADNERDDLVGSLTARLPTHCMRLALTFAAIEDQDAITRRDLEAALAVADYAAASARFVFGEKTGDPVADRLLSAIRKAGAVGLDATAQSAALGRHVRGEKLERIRRDLEAHGLIRTDQIETSGRPRTLSRACEFDEKCEERGEGT